MQLWELAARESIRDTITRYAQAGDRLMIEEMAGTFCADGVLETHRDHRTWVGRAAIAERLSGGRGTSAAQARAAAVSARAPGEKVILRHLVSNIHFDEVTPRQARVSSYFTVLTGNGLDHFGRYRDLLVPVGDRWLFRHRVVTRDWERSEPPVPS